jgi:hypothetical protein
MDPARRYPHEAQAGPRDQLLLDTPFSTDVEDV